MPTIRKRLDQPKPRKAGRRNRFALYTTRDGHVTRIECQLEHVGDRRYRRVGVSHKWVCEGCGDVQDEMDLVERQVVALTRDRNRIKKVSQTLYLATTQIGDQVFSVTFFAQDLRAVKDILVQHAEQWIALGKNELDLLATDKTWPRKAVDAGFRKEPEAMCYVHESTENASNWTIRRESLESDNVRGLWRSLGDFTGALDRVILDLNNMRQLVLALEDQSEELAKRIRSLRVEMKAQHENSRLVVQERAAHGRQIQG